MPTPGLASRQICSKTTERLSAESLRRSADKTEKIEMTVGESTPTLSSGLNSHFYRNSSQPLTLRSHSFEIFSLPRAALVSRSDLEERADCSVSGSMSALSSASEPQLVSAESPPTRSSPRRSLGFVVTIAPTRHRSALSTSPICDHSSPQRIGSSSLVLSSLSARPSPGTLTLEELVVRQRFAA